MKGIIPQGKPCTRCLRQLSAAANFVGEAAGVLNPSVPYSLDHARARQQAGGTVAISLRSSMKHCFFAFIILLYSCVSTDHFIEVDALVSREDFTNSARLLQERKRNVYRKRDRVLYFLDTGMLHHFDGNYEESSVLLRQAEQAIEENFAVSISQEIGTFIMNDRTREYDGEDYEDIYLNVFNALNYYHLGNKEGALVEIRRMNNKLQHLSVKYGQIISDIQKHALEKGAEIPPNPEATTKFSNSALARYLGMLFFRSEGMMDSARIDQNQLLLAFSNAPSIYKNPVPSSIRHELHIPQGMARLNIIGFAGRSPVKQEETTRIFLGNSWIKVALPVMKMQPSMVSTIQVVFDSGESLALELLEDIDEVAAAAFTLKKGLIYTKSIARASIKGVTTSVLYSVGQGDDGMVGALFTLLGVAGQVMTEAGEQADLRMGRYFPGKAYVGGINLAPGTYSFTITFFGRNKETIAVRRHEDVLVAQDTLNLTEVVCLR